MCLASASPVKFEESVTAAGLQYVETESVQKLRQMPTKYQDLEKGDDFTEIIKNKIEELTSKFEANKNC